MLDTKELFETYEPLAVWKRREAQMGETRNA
jgi:hypothetical protein